MSAPTSFPRLANLRLSGERGIAVLAFGCIYLIWGSTYLAIRFAVEVLPPFLMIGTRCLIAGTVLYFWTLATGTAAANRRQWLQAVVPGVLFFATGQGLLGYAQRLVPSGAAALLIATVPIWLLLYEARHKRPGGRTIAGVAFGVGGVVLLVAPGVEAGGIHPLGGGLVVLCALSWALATIATRSSGQSGPQTAAMHLVLGGAASCGIGALRGELAELVTVQLSAKPLLAFAYLTIFGTLVAFSAYAWLLRRFEASTVGTYAFVNPVLAVLVGWALGGEALSTASIAAAAAVVTGVYLVVTSKRPASAPAPDPAPVGPVEQALCTAST